MQADFGSRLLYGEIVSSLLQRHRLDLVGESEAGLQADLSKQRLDCKVQLQGVTQFRQLASERLLGSRQYLFTVTAASQVTVLEVPLDIVEL